MESRPKILTVVTAILLTGAMSVSSDESRTCTDGANCEVSLDAAQKVGGAIGVDIASIAGSLTVTGPWWVPQKVKDAVQATLRRLLGSLGAELGKLVTAKVRVQNSGLYTYPCNDFSHGTWSDPQGKTVDAAPSFSQGVSGGIRGIGIHIKGKVEPKYDVKDKRFITDPPPNGPSAMGHSNLDADVTVTVEFEVGAVLSVNGERSHQHTAHIGAAVCQLQAQNHD